tara:strand:+ start:3324 stop:3836 length:513 start_codon:yes stop_codon:yes gene_type:complete
MYILKKIIVIIFVLSLLNTSAHSDQNVRFADIDFIVQNTEIGKNTLIKIEKINKSNIDKLNGLQKKLKDRENEIKIKKKIISEDEFNREVEKLKKQISDFNKKKDTMVKNYTDVKNRELKSLFATINPIIQNYMNENSIEILINSKNLFMGNVNSDLTKVLIKEINNKIK